MLGRTGNETNVIRLLPSLILERSEPTLRVQRHITIEGVHGGRKQLLMGVVYIKHTR